jgi:tetratricopeptide (TPR) repeat protein
MTRSVAGGRRFGLVLAGVALVAVVGGGIFLFRPAAPPRAAPVPAAAVAVPEPRPTPPPTAAPPAPSPAPSVAAPAPKAPAAAPRPKAAAPTSAAPGGGVGGQNGGGGPAKLSAEQLKTVEDAIALAQVFQDRGDPERALREYQRALAIDPKHPEARKGAAEAQAALKGKR